MPLKKKQKRVTQKNMIEWFIIVACNIEINKAFLKENPLGMLRRLKGRELNIFIHSFSIILSYFYSLLVFSLAVHIIFLTKCFNIVRKKMERNTSTFKLSRWP